MPGMVSSSQSTVTVKPRVVLDGAAAVDAGRDRAAVAAGLRRRAAADLGCAVRARSDGRAASATVAPCWCAVRRYRQRAVSSGVQRVVGLSPTPGSMAASSWPVTTETSTSVGLTASAISAVPLGRVRVGVTANWVLLGSPGLGSGRHSFHWSRTPVRAARRCKVALSIGQPVAHCMPSNTSPGGEGGRGDRVALPWGGLDPGVDVDRSGEPGGVDPELGIGSHRGEPHAGRVLGVPGDAEAQDLVDHARRGRRGDDVHPDLAVP